jgi:hypothetical protein
MRIIIETDRTADEVHAARGQPETAAKNPSKSKIERDAARRRLRGAVGAAVLAGLMSIDFATWVLDGIDDEVSS